MPIPNKILPPENLSTREIVLRKIHSFNGQPFTVKDISRLTRPKIKVDNVRFHLDVLASDLYIEKLPRQGPFYPMYYRWNDKQLEQIKSGSTPDGPVQEHFRELASIARRALTGELVPPDELQGIRDDLYASLEMVKTELDGMLKLYNCHDLWTVKTLTDRIGFVDGLRFEDQQDSTPD